MLAVPSIEPRRGDRRLAERQAAVIGRDLRVAEDGEAQRLQAVAGLLEQDLVLEAAARQCHGVEARAVAGASVRGHRGDDRREPLVEARRDDRRRRVRGSRSREQRAATSASGSTSRQAGVAQIGIANG